LAASVVLALSLLSAALASDETPVRTWRLDEFVISVWGGPNSPELARCLAEEAHFNTVMGGPGWTGEQGAGVLDLADCHGLRVLLKIAPEEVTPAVSRHPALWGYYVFDEPVQCNVTYESLAPTVEAFRTADATHPIYINLNNADDPAAFISTLDPEVLSIDRYQWWFGREDYFPLLERYRALSLQQDLPLLWWVEANADENRYHTPPDNQRKLRQSVFTALAYGVKGIQWFGWGEACSWERSPDPERWQLKPAGRDVAAINADLRRLGPVLMGLRSVAVYHTVPLPPETHPLPEGCWVRTDAPDTVLGLFQDAQRRDFVLVANRDHDRRQAVALRLTGPVTAVHRFSRRTGHWLPLALGEASQPRVTVRLQPGDGELLRVTR
jgi:hypothetical protein